MASTLITPTVTFDTITGGAKVSGSFGGLHAINTHGGVVVDGVKLGQNMQVSCSLNVSSSEWNPSQIYAKLIVTGALNTSVLVVTGNIGVSGSVESVQFLKAVHSGDAVTAGASTNGSIWYDTATNQFKGVANGVVVTFTVA